MLVELHLRRCCDVSLTLLIRITQESFGTGALVEDSKNVDSRSMVEHASKITLHLRRVLFFLARSMLQGQVSFPSPNRHFAIRVRVMDHRLVRILFCILHRVKDGASI